MGALNPYSASFKTRFFEVHVNAMRGGLKIGNSFHATRMDRLFEGENLGCALSTDTKSPDSLLFGLFVFVLSEPRYGFVGTRRAGSGERAHEIPLDWNV